MWTNILSDNPACSRRCSFPHINAAAALQWTLRCRTCPNESRYRHYLLPGPSLTMDIIQSVIIMKIFPTCRLQQRIIVFKLKLILSRIQPGKQFLFYQLSFKEIFHCKTIFVHQLFTLRCLELKNFFSPPAFLHSKQIFSQNCEPLTSAAFSKVCEDTDAKDQKCQSKNLKSFMWNTPSLLYRVVGSMLPKHFYFGEKSY